MLGLLRPLALVVAERGLVDEQVCALREVEERQGRRGVAGDAKSSARSRLPENLLGPHDGAVGQRDRLSRLEPAAIAPCTDAQRVCGLDVEAARPRLLYEGIAERRHAVRDPERRNAVVAP